MSDEPKLTTQEPQEPVPPPAPSGQDKGARTRPVILYIGIMFAVAMLLLLISFLMQQRNHEVLMESMESVQSVVDLELDNQKLEEQLKQVQGKLASTQEALEQLQGDYQTALESQSLAEQQRTALQFLLEIRHSFDLRQYSNARELVAEFEASGLTGALPETGPDEAAQTPSQLYQSILAALDKS